MLKKLSDEIGILQKQCFSCVVFELPQLCQSEKVTLEVEKVY